MIIILAFWLWDRSIIEDCIIRVFSSIIDFSTFGHVSFFFFFFKNNFNEIDTLLGADYMEKLAA